MISGLVNSTRGRTPRFFSGAKEGGQLQRFTAKVIGELAGRGRRQGQKRPPLRVDGGEKWDELKERKFTL